MDAYGAAVHVDHLSDDPLATRFFEVLIRMVKGSQHQAMAITAEYDLTLTQLRLLYLLDHAPEPLPVSSLGEAVGLSVAATGRAIDALVKSGLVERNEDPVDRRIKRISLSEAGHEALERITRARFAAISAFVGALDPDERTSLGSAIDAPRRTRRGPLPPCRAAGLHPPHDRPLFPHAGDPRMSHSGASPGHGYENTGTTLDGALLRVAAVVVLGTFMSILDTTIVNVAINDLAKEFQATLPTIQWVVDGLHARARHRHPPHGLLRRPVRHEAALHDLDRPLPCRFGALSGAAWSAESLIVFRVLQGLGGGMIMPAGMTILTQTAGPQRMGRVMGVVGVPMLLGPILGPILGGFFVDNVSWRWIFYVNLPVGAVALFLAARFLPTDEPKPHHRLDWLGVLMLSPPAWRSSSMASRRRRPPAASARRRR